MAGPVIHIFRNFPLQYIYYNQLVGGVDKAFKKYETDYYLVSLKPGTEWIKEDLLPSQKKEHRQSFQMPLQQRLHITSGIMPIRSSLPYTRYYDRGIYNWDYAVFFMNYIDPCRSGTGYGHRKIRSMK